MKMIQEIKTLMVIPQASMFILLAILLTASIFDVRSRRIPVKLVVFSAAAAVIFSFMFYKTDNLFDHISGSLTAFFVMAVLMLIARRQIGGGDLAMMVITGFFAGIGSFLNILFYSMLLTGIYSVILIIAGKGVRKTEVPFAPFILLATGIMTILS